VLSPNVDNPDQGCATAALLTDDAVRATHRRAVWILACAQITGGLGIGAGVSVGGLLALDISGSEIWAGGGSTASVLGAALLALPLAAVAARSGRRTSLSLGWGISAVGAAVVVLAAILNSYLVLIVGMLMVGSGAATSLQSRYAATDLALPSKRGRDLSLVVWSTTVGTVLGPNLSEPGRVVAQALNIPSLVGPFVFSAIGMLIAAVLTLVLMRPDPLLLAQEMDLGLARKRAAESFDPSAADPAATAVSVWSAVWHEPRARLGLSAIVLSHAVMVAVMTMAPVHLRHHEATLTIVGLTISLHIAGMFAFSPIFGWLADRRGRVLTIVVGQVLLAASVLTAGTSGTSEPQLMAGLLLLGLGWSAGLVAGSTLLAESVPSAIRLRTQGTSDLVMNLVGAGGAALSGVLVAGIGFGGLNVAVGVLILPTLIFALTATRR